MYEVLRNSYHITHTTQFQSTKPVFIDLTKLFNKVGSFDLWGDSATHLFGIIGSLDFSSPANFSAANAATPFGNGLSPRLWFFKSFNFTGKFGLMISLPLPVAVLAQTNFCHFLTL